MPEATFDGTGPLDASSEDGTSGYAGASGQADGSGAAGSGGVAGASGTGGASGTAGASGAAGAACDPGWIDCDGESSNGCEVNSAADPLHCGSCGAKCPSPPNSEASCAAGNCAFQCQGDYADCNKSASDGCEVDTAAEEAHCGACDFACVLAHASVACVAGQCTIAQCDYGFAACDTNVANGCEVSLLTDPAHCGSCEKACPGATNAEGVCVNGACALVCETDWADCDGDPKNGCEAAKRDYPAAVLADAPVAYWRLGEDTGPQAKDATGHGHDGSYAGTHVRVAGAIACDPDGAAEFNPTLDAHVTVPRDAALEPATTLTVELWFRQTGTPTQYQKMIWYGNPSKAPWGSWGIERQASQPGIFTYYVATSPNPEWLDIPNLEADTWYHLVLSYDGALLSGYLNGAFVASYPDTGPIGYDHQHGLVIGGAGSNFDLFSGALDEVAVYDKVLSPARILAHYQAGKP